MQDKSKLTLYVPRDLHRKLKIKAAVDDEAMSSIVERAIVFYLTHPHVVDEVEASLGSVSHGQTHRVYNCPGCESPYVIRDGEMISLASHVGVVQDGAELADRVSATQSSDLAAPEVEHPGEESLVPC
ncbi:MAG: hypothetical protein OHK0037_08970 [Elainellaceae cyanobacterium]